MGYIGATANQNGFTAPLADVQAAGLTGVFDNLTDEQRSYPALGFGGTGTGLALSLDQKRAARGVLAVLGAMTVCVILSDATASTWLILAIPTFFAGMSTVGPIRSKISAT